MSFSGRPLARILVCAVLLAVLLPVLASACPLCKDSNADSGPGMWRGMYWSILLMMAVPFAAAGTVAMLVVRARRRQARSQPAAPAPLPFPSTPGARP